MEEKKTAITAEKLIDLYAEQVLINGKKPSTVFAFAKKNNIDEAVFYQFFSNFTALENSFFSVLFSKTLEVLNESEDYQNYESKDKLLSFYFTFFENLKANRSFTVYLIDEKTKPLENLSKLKGLRKVFLEYVDTLAIETTSIEQQQIQEFQERAQQELVWIQLLSILKFWLNDSSTSFEKTDVFIEKSVDVGFEILDNKRLNKFIDFGKFLFKEGKKTFMNE